MFYVLWRRRVLSLLLFNFLPNMTREGRWRFTGLEDASHSGFDYQSNIGARAGRLETSEGEERDIGWLTTQA
jgi:hypothetical protein